MCSNLFFAIFCSWFLLISERFVLNVLTFCICIFVRGKISESNLLNYVEWGMHTKTVNIQCMMMWNFCFIPILSHGDMSNKCINKISFQKCREKKNAEFIFLSNESGNKTGHIIILRILQQRQIFESKKNTSLQIKKAIHSKMYALLYVCMQTQQKRVWNSWTVVNWKKDNSNNNNINNHFDLSIDLNVSMKTRQFIIKRTRKKEKNDQSKKKNEKIFMWRQRQCCTVCSR